MKKRDLFLFIGIIILDQITKYFVFSTNNFSVEVIKDFFYINQVKNTGAAWGMFSGMMILFYIFTVVAIYFLVKLYRESKDRAIYLQFAIVLMLAGAIGNFIDRLALGYVRDFLDFFIFGYDFPLFNVADSAIVIGVMLTIFYMIKNPHEEIL